MVYLFVIAHPDDEVLGAGATIYKLTKEGHEVNLCILSGEAGARDRRPDIKELQEDIHNSGRLLGVNQIILGDFPNIEFNTVPHLKLVQFIEKAVAESQADIVFTHHPSDLNNDHYNTSIACQAAIRKFQRKPDTKPVKELLFMEIPSSTEWYLNKSMNAFLPNTFIEVGMEYLEKKLEALSQYRFVMRDFPHPRSKEALIGLAAYRGCQAGLLYAEAFESVFRRIV